MKKFAVVSVVALMLAGCGGPKVQGNPSQQGQAPQVKLNSGPEVNPAAAKSTLALNTGPTMFVVDIAGHPTASFKDSGGLTVWTGSKSAPQQGINSTQILGPVITRDGKLVFFDLNQGNPVTLNYALHFNNGVPSVDPIIDNGGNNR